MQHPKQRFLLIASLALFSTLSITARNKENKKDIQDFLVHTKNTTEQEQQFLQLIKPETDSLDKKYIISPLDARKLHLFQGPKTSPEHCLTSVIPITTIPGKIALKEQLLLCNQGQQNQEAVRYFSQNPKEHTRILNALKKIHDGFGLFLTFFDEVDEDKNIFFNNLFFEKSILKPLNKSMAAIGFLRLIQRTGNATSFIPCTAFGTLSKNIIETISKKIIENIMSEKNDSEISAYSITSDVLQTLWRTSKDICIEIIARHYPYNNQRTSEKTSLSLIDPKKRVASLGDQYTILHETFTQVPYAHRITTKYFKSPDFAAKAASGITTLALDALDTYRAYLGAQNIRLDNAIINNMHTRLMGVAQIVDGLTEIEEVAQRSKIPVLIDYAEKITSFLHNPKQSSLIGKLKTNTFKGSTSYFSNRPRILTAYTFMNENKEKFIEPLQSAGLFDSLAAITKLISTNQSSNAPFCLVNFSQEALPSINCIDFWNPLVSQKFAVTNTIKLGKHNVQNILITGPNGSGKSTNMCGITLNIILAQTFGIAAAHKMELTPFTHINIYLNEQEDIKNGKSTFMAESERLNMICKEIKELRSNEKAFTIMDEVARGTLEEVGSQMVYDAGKAISEQPQSISFIATHFKKPTKLEQDTGGKIANYYVAVDETENHEFLRTFKLVRGINYWWCHNKEKRDRFISWLTKKYQ